MTDVVGMATESTCPECTPVFLVRRLDGALECPECGYVDG